MEIRKSTVEIIQQADAFFVEQGKGKPTTAQLMIKCLEICEDNYKSLLQKYIEHVKECEGVDYINNGCSMGEERKFTPEELKLLIELAGKPTF